MTGRIGWVMCLVLCWLPVQATAGLPGGMQSVAQARACYAGVFKLYAAEYLRGAEGESCVRLSYLRGFSAAELDRATRKVLTQRHGDDWLQGFSAEVAEVGAAYRAVAKGDSYSYCIERGAGVLLRDDAEVLRIDSPGFAEDFMQIWVRGEDETRAPQWGFTQC